MYKRDYEQIDDNQFVIVKYYFNQYASGICGVTKHQTIHSPQNGWDSQKEAIGYAKEKGFRRYTRNGIDEGYGEVGCVVSKYWVVRKKNAHTKLNSYDYVSYELVK